MTGFFIIILEKVKEHLKRRVRNYCRTCMVSQHELMGSQSGVFRLF